MSMWFHLAKLDEVSLAAVLQQPKLLEDVLLGESPELPGVFDAEKDTFSDDWRVAHEASEAYAGSDVNVHPDPDPDGFDTWLMRAVNGTGGRPLDVELTYGPCWVLTADQVAEMAAGLAAESDGLEFPDDEAEDDDEVDPTYLYCHLIDELGTFYSAAAAQGRAIVGGVN